MAKEKKYDNVFSTTPKPVAGIALFQDAEKKETSIEEMLEKQGKRELMEAQKEEAIAKMEARTKKLHGTDREEKPTQPGGRDYIILEDEPVRVGENLGDYSLQDAKDILGLRALRSRFAGGQAGAGQVGAAGAGGAAEKVSDVLTALSPYLNKGSDIEQLKEILADKLALQRQEILSQIPHPGQPAQPKSFIEQITEAVAAFSSLKEVGPLLRSILGVPESPGGNSSAGKPVQVNGPDGNPLVMDLGQVIDWRRFQNDERRADGRHDALVGLAQTVRENVGDGISALKMTAEAAREGTGTKAAPAAAPAAEPQPQVFSCGDCKTQFSAPAGWEGQPLKCPNPACGREYTKEDLMA